jgi:phosphoribosyl 1,2-cyclic phosphodiesterase
MGHLHLDHAGGLENFRWTNIPVYTHEIELGHAFYSVATKSDLGVYLLHYLQFNMNWQTRTGDSLELCQGVTLRHASGHTPGLSIMVVNIKDSGTWIFTTDQYHIKENEEGSHPQGVCIFSEHKISFYRLFGELRGLASEAIFGLCNS